MQGRYLAEVRIPDDADVFVLQTGRDPFHYRVMGTPATLRSLVAYVMPSDAAGCGTSNPNTCGRPTHPRRLHGWPPHTPAGTS
jgi:hypothetical protein